MGFSPECSRESSPVLTPHGPVKVRKVPRRGTRSLAVGETYGRVAKRYSNPQGPNIHGRSFPWVSPTAHVLRPLRGCHTGATLTEPCTTVGGRGCFRQ